MARSAPPALELPHASGIGVGYSLFVLSAMRRRVRFQDVDAAGILFFVRAFEYFHDALMEHYALRGIDLPRVIADGPWAAPIVHSAADFKAPMRYGDAVVVELERADIGRTSIEVFYRVKSADDDMHVFCTGKSVSVFIDRTTSRPCEVPVDVRAAFS